MPVINGVYLKDFTALPGSVADANIIPIAITGDNIAYRTTVSGIVTDARITSKLLTGLSVTGGAVVAADTILQAFGKVQNQINGKQGTVTLTTTGTSGAATFVSNTLNIPNYGSALTGYVPYTGATQDVDLGAFKLNAQSFHVKGTAGNGHLGLKHQSSAATASANESSLFADSNGDMSFQNANLYLNKFVTSANSANRTYTFPDATGTVALVGGSGVGTVTSVAALTLGTTGADLSSTVATGTTTPVITLQVPTASAANRGALSSADWSTFNGKQGTIALTTTGTSGAATFSANTLNIPNYADGGVLSLSAIGAVPNANAATITGTVLNLQPASASFGGVVTTGVQTFAGAKTLTGALSGTSATFSSSVSIGGADQGYQLDVKRTSTGDSTFDTVANFYKASTHNTGLLLRLKNTIVDLAANNITGGGGPSAGMSFSVSSGGTISTALTLASTGAATFSSTIAATSATFSSNITFSNTNTGINYGSSRFFLYNGNTYVGDIDGLSSGSLILRTNGTDKLIITSGGAATFSSSVTATSLIKSGGTSSQFLMADGSVNTSVLPSGAYLPLAGGPLTGALSGTSATFNGNLLNTNSNFQTYGSTSFGASTWGLSIGNGGASANYYRANDHYFQNGAGTQTLQIASTGAATFSSSVTATAFIPSGATVPTNGMYLSAANTLDFATNTTNRLSIASTGAATFSSTNAKTNTGNWHETISDTTSMAAGVGGGISFTGYKTGTSAQGLYAAIDGYKTNATAGNELGGFRIWTSNGTNLVKQLDITDTGAATFSSSVTATSFFESSSIKGKDIIKTNPLTNLNLDVIQYTRKTDESKDVRYGYSAEQIHSLMPELTDKDVTAVKYLDVHTILIAQLQQEIRELKAKLN